MFNTTHVHSPLGDKVNSYKRVTCLSPVEIIFNTSLHIFRADEKDPKFKNGNDATTNIADEISNKLDLFICFISVIYMIKSYFLLNYNQKKNLVKILKTFFIFNDGLKLFLFDFKADYYIIR